jgi:hypothetical protein
MDKDATAIRHQLQPVLAQITEQLSQQVFPDGKP